jgi:hypothetical protein
LELAQIATCQLHIAGRAASREVLPSHVGIAGGPKFSRLASHLYMVYGPLRAPSRVAEGHERRASTVQSIRVDGYKYANDTYHHKILDFAGE